MNAGDVIIASGSNGFSGFGISVTLDGLPNYTEFTNLFDQYKITYVKFYFVNRGTNLSMIESYNNAALGMPQMVICVDKDDIATPASSEAGMNAIRERAKARSFCWTPEKRVFTIGWKPNVLGAVYESGISTAYTPKTNTWIDCSDPATPHYGLKGVIQVPFSTGVMPGELRFDVYATVYVSCRGTH